MKINRRFIYVIGVACLFVIVMGVLFRYLRQPPAIVAKIERLGGEVNSRYAATTWSLAEPLRLRRLESPKSIRIHSNQFTDEDLLALSRFESFFDLNVQSSSITDRSLQELARTREITDEMHREGPFPQVLSDVKINCPRVTDEGLAPLRQAVLTDVQVVAGPDVDGSFLHEWRDSRTLRFLAIHGKTIGDSVVGDICQMQKVENVNLSDTSVSDECMAKFAEMPHLVHLNVRRTQVTGKGVEKLRSLLQRKVVILADGEQRSEIVN